MLIVSFVAWTDESFVIFLDNVEVSNRVGKWYVGLRQLSDAEEDQYGPGVTPGDPTPLTGQFTTNYTLHMFTSGCYFYYAPTNDWRSRGCTVGLQYTRYTVYILCLV